MNVYFGKTLDANLIASHECKAPDEKYFGGIQPDDYAFIRLSNDHANLSRLWKFRSFERRGNDVHACFDDVFSFNEISTEKFVKLSLFKINTNLVIFTSRQSKGVGFFKLEINDSTLLSNSISGVNAFNDYLDDDVNYRKIIFVNNPSTAKSDTDVQISKNGDLVELFNSDKPFLSGFSAEFDGNRYIQFKEFLRLYPNVASDNRKYAAQKKVMRWLESGGTNKPISFLNLWDFFCSKQEFRGENIEETDIENEPVETKVVEKHKMNTESISETLKNYIEKNFKQIILTGAPGTGKTFSVKEYTGSGPNVKFVQFHPSYDYADFVEGLRPVMLSKGGVPTFVRIDGTFKKFCRMIVEENYKKMYSSELKDITGIDGDQKYKKFVSKYAEIENRIELGKYFFIIDEINRADLSKVFGELMYCLENSYRGLKDESGHFNTIETQYSNLNTHVVKKGIAKEVEFDCFANGFFIPKNLYIIGTMNDIDRSVEAFDFALRRRFEWVDIKANLVFYKGARGMLPSSVTDDQVKDLTKKVVEMNKEMSKEGNPFMLTEAFHIGHAYFKAYDGTDDSLKEIFNTNITSILKEYTRGRREKDVQDNLITPCGKKLGVIKDE